MILTRFAHFEDRIIGRLIPHNDENLSFYTIELPWENNKPYLSCIPVGLYKVQRTHSRKQGSNSWEIVNVVGRTHIRFDVANYAHNIEGCIGLGNSIIGNLLGVGNSRNANNTWKDYTEDLNEFILSIQNGFLQPIKE